MKIDYWRQLDVFDPSKNNIHVTVIGAGAIGSWVVLALAKSGINNITVYDFDTVEEHNFPNQYYTPENSRKLKVTALYERIYKDCLIKINCIPEAVTKNTKLKPGIVYLCTDTMSSRKEIWENVIKYNLDIPMMIETRLGAEMGMIYTINPIDLGHITKYEQTLYSDNESEESPCTYRAIITVVMTLAGIAAHKTIKYVKGHNYNTLVAIKEGGNHENVGVMCIRPLLITTGKF